VTEIIAREHRSGTDWLHLDMGVFQGIMEPLEMRSWKYPTFTEKNPRGYKKDFVLTGPTCDAFDTIGTDYSLPSEMNTGDKVYIGSAGAYTSVYGSTFNGFEVPKTYFIN
jgi:ornithine decarboxylase